MRGKKIYVYLPIYKPDDSTEANDALVMAVSISLFPALYSLPLPKILTQTLGRLVCVLEIVGSGFRTRVLFVKD